METPNVIRVCTLCDEPYAAGTYRQHADAHTPLRKSRAGIQPSPTRDVILEMLHSGTRQVEIARLLGVSRQRVHQVAHVDELGRTYRVDKRRRKSA